ncbi:MAG: GntR family transcriptional regulator [Gemmatimonadota bacterium]
MYNIRMRIATDPESPVPLFHQIAEALRYRIATGELRARDPLPSIRVAADSFGVHFLTVRKAYQSLEKDGLVRSRRGVGTWVLDSEAGLPAASARAVEAFLEETVRNGWRHGLDSAGLVIAIVRHARAAAPRSKTLPAAEVHFVECNEPQAADYAEQVRLLLGIPVGTWLLDMEEEPPAGLLIGTYFHFNEIRSRWPGRGRDLRFLPVQLDPMLASRLGNPQTGGGRTTVQLCETNAARAHNVMPDLSTILPPDRFQVQPLLVESPSEALEGSENSSVLFSPRLWARLDERSRRDPRAILLRYLVSAADAGELFQTVAGHSEEARRRVTV